MYTAVQSWLSKSGILSLDGAFLESSRRTRWHAVVYLSSCPVMREREKTARKLVSRRAVFFYQPPDKPHEQRTLRVLHILKRKI